MQVQYTLDGEDLRRWHRHMLRTRPAYAWRFLVAASGETSLLLVAFAVLGGFDHFKTVPILLFAAGVVAASCWFGDWYVGRPENHRIGVIGEQEFSIAPEGFQVRSSVDDGFHSWRVIRKVETTNDYLYLYVSNFAAHIIPSRAFSTSDEAVGFHDRILDHVNSTLVPAESHDPDSLSIRLGPRTRRSSKRQR